MKFSVQSILNEGTYPETPIISQLFPKGQKISKANYGVLNSSKKTNETHYSE